MIVFKILLYIFVALGLEQGFWLFYFAITGNNRVLNILNINYKVAYWLTHSNTAFLGAVMLIIYGLHLLSENKRKKGE